jgi:SAM-dependent methyltransferase
LKQKLCDIISCPHDHELLAIASEQERDAGELITGELECAAGHRFPVTAGVPRLHGDAHGAVEPEPLGTVDTFTEKWSRVSPEELEQRFAQQYEWYVQRFGWGDESALSEFLQDRGTILEAGTGLGGDAARVARLSKDSEVIGLDFSTSVTIAHRHFASLPNLHYVQADLRRPPFHQKQLDFISADQVIHHTPDAASSFRILAGLLGDGASFAVYLYKRKAPLRELIDDWTRERTTKMSVEECMQFSESMTELGRELTQAGATIRLERTIPLLGIEAGEYDVQRFLYWHFLKCFWSPDFSVNLNNLVNFDWYHPAAASRHTPDEVLRWCREASLAVDHVDVGDAGISVLARAGA